MTRLNFTLRPDSCARIHDALVCMSKFSDTVAIEAKVDQLVLSALNLAKSGYASFMLDPSQFFESYEFQQTSSHADGRFACEINNKALQSVFKGRLLDVRKGETAVDRCDVTLQDGQDEAACRFVFKMICDQGVVKTYKLTYEAVEVMHALFDRNTANNHWSMRSIYLKEFIEYFGPRTEQLDFCFGPNQVTFTSFTEKIVSANKGEGLQAQWNALDFNDRSEVLRQPLQTAVAINTSDFEELSVQDELHIKINVKDFRAIVAHAVTLNSQFNANFSRPGRPLQFQYNAFGMECAFTLMTVSDGRAAPTPAAANTQKAQPKTTKRPVESARPTQTTISREGPHSNTMPPPPVPPGRRPLGRNQPGSAAASQGLLRQNLDPESLFVPQDDDDQQWDPQNLDEGEALRWDATADNENTFHPTFKDTASTARTPPTNLEEGLEPTQRISQIKGLW